MARKFNLVKPSTATTMQFNAGLILNKFDPTGTVEINQETDIISATTGGINASAIPSFVDLYEDVDNAPNNTKEGKEIESWECKIATSIFENSLASIKLALGVADIDTANGKVTPRATVSQADFTDVWFVGGLKGGGMVAVKLINALSDGGFNLQTTKNGKGTIELSLVGHSSIVDTSIVPMQIYVSDGTDTTSMSQETPVAKISTK